MPHTQLSFYISVQFWLNSDLFKLLGDLIYLFPATLVSDSDRCVNYSNTLTIVFTFHLSVNNERIGKINALIEE